MRTPRTPILILAALGTLLVLPTASATTYAEGFETCAQGDVPDVDPDCGLAEYNYQVYGPSSFSANFVSNAAGSFGEGSNALRFSGAPGVGSSAFGDFATPSGAVVNCNTGLQYFQAALYFDTLLGTSAGTLYFGVTDSPGATLAASSAATALGFEVADDTGAVRVFSKLGGGGVPSFTAISGFTLAADTWYLFSIECTAAQKVWRISNQAGGIEAQTVLANSNNANMPSVGFQMFGATSTMTYYVDELEYGDFVPATPGRIFCADAGLEAGEDGSVDDFGYEYVEDWSFDSSINQAGADLTDGYVADMEPGDSAYFGKGFDLGSPAVSVHFRIEAANDLEDSIFRAAFTLGNAGTPSNANKGDGTDGGDFDDHVGVRLEEEGDNWRMTIRQNVGGAGYSQVGASIAIDDPNDPTTYNFTVDSRTLTARLLHLDGTELLSRTIDASFQDQLWENQWFVATTGTLLSARTWLDNNDQGDSGRSTCIYDLVGGAVASNTEGSDDQTITEEPEDEDTGPGAAVSIIGIDTVVPEGFTESSLKFFLGLVMTGAIGTGLWATTGRNLYGLVGGLILGFLLAFAFGLINLWVILLLVIVSVAIIILMLRRGG